MQTKDQTILESVQHAYPLLRHIAFSYAQDYDELYQVAAEAALKAYDKAQQARDFVGYVHRSIRNAILVYVEATDRRPQTLADHYLITSLDAPITRRSREQTDLSLYGFVSQASSPSTDERDYSRLYVVLDTLPDIYREILCMRYGLCGYGAHRVCDIARILGIHYSTAKSRFGNAKNLLRQHIELLDLVGSQA